MKIKNITLLIGIYVLLSSIPATLFASPVEVLRANAQCKKDICSFSVTVRHDDNGWKHYANAWYILDAKGNILGTRVLVHPHDTEQPFTRSLSGVVIPIGITEVQIKSVDILAVPSPETMDAKTLQSIEGNYFTLKLKRN